MFERFQWLLTWTSKIRTYIDRFSQKKKESYSEIYELEQKMQAVDAAGDENSSHHTRWDIASWWKFWLTWVVVVYLGYIFFSILTVVYLILTGFIVSMAIESLILYFQKFAKRGMAIFFAYVLFIIFALSWFLLIIPFVFQQTADLIQVFVSWVTNIQVLVQSQWIESIIMSSFMPGPLKDYLVTTIQQSDFRDSLQNTLLNNTSQLVSLGTSYIKGASDVAIALVSGFLTTLVQMSIMLTLSVFFSIEKNKVISFISRISWRVQTTELKLKKLYKKLWFWLEGQLILCLSIFLLFWLGLVIISWFGIDLPNKITLALIAWLFEFIPYLWPTLWAVPAVLVASIAFWWKWFIAVIAMNVVIQQLENNVLVPLVMYHTLWVSPLLILICMIGGATMLGVLGILLAVPIAVIVTILFEDYQQPVQHSGS
jgi:predicted PurR-regulated permease PerM